MIGQNDNTTQEADGWVRGWKLHNDFPCWYIYQYVIIDMPVSGVMLEQEAQASIHYNL